MKKSCAIIGCGKAFQVLHMNNIKRNYKILSIYDPRPKLLQLVSKRLNVKKKFNNLNLLLKKTKVKIFFCFLPREISFSAIKKIIKKKKIVLFLEKPPILFFENLLKIKSTVNLSKIKIGYMFNYDKNVLRLKKIFQKEKTFHKINGNFSINYDIRSNKYIRTKENYITKELPVEKKILSQKLSNKRLISYLIFLNRYSHLINLLNFLIGDFKFIKSKNYSLYNYKYTFKKKIFFDINFNNKKKYEIFLNIKLPSKICKLKIIYKNQRFFSYLNILTPNKKFAYTSNEDLYKKEVMNISENKLSDTGFEQYGKALNICHNSFFNTKNTNHI